MKKKTNQYVIVRCSAAGVWAGEIVSKKRDEITLKNARRLWRWWSIFSLSELAIHGPRPDKIAENKYGEPIGCVTLSGWCEILPASKNAEKLIRGIKSANT